MFNTVSVLNFPRSFCKNQNSNSTMTERATLKYDIRRYLIVLHLDYVYFQTNYNNQNCIRMCLNWNRVELNFLLIITDYLKVLFIFIFTNIV